MVMTVAIGILCAWLAPADGQKGIERQVVVTITPAELDGAFSRRLLGTHRPT
jgi:hypothetical protein